MVTNPLKSQETRDRIRDLVNAALTEKNISGRQASLAIVGHDGLVRDIRAGRLPALDKLEALFELLGLELYFGHARSAEPAETITPDSQDFAQVPVHRASLAAGDGATNADATLIDHLAFRRSWLKRIGVAPTNAVLARAQGDSMLPAIHSGDMLLIDQSKREIPVRKRGPKDKRPAPIYALLDELGARVKRIERPEPNVVMLLSDNPAFTPEVLTGAKTDTLNIIGKVMWWGHTVRE